jgi:hypothetical protein
MFNTLDISNDSKVDIVFACIIALSLSYHYFEFEINFFISINWFVMKNTIDFKSQF